MKPWLKNLLFFLSGTGGAIGLAFGLFHLKVGDENIYLIFMLSLLLVIIETKNIFYGIGTALLCVASFNFFFTVPYNSFAVDDYNTYISFVIFLAIAFVTSALVARLQKQIGIANKNEQRVKAMYDISSRFLNLSDRADVYLAVVNYINKTLAHNACISLLNGTTYGNNEPFAEEAAAKDYCLKRNVTIYRGDLSYPALPVTLCPIKSRLNDYGVLAVSNEGKEVPADERSFLKGIVEELVIALDRDYILSEREANKVQVEKERFKTSLLRGLSHDIKTPLTMIQSGSEFMLSSYSKLSEKEKKALIEDIYQQSMDLYDFVSNLLNLTRLEEQRKIVNPEVESCDEILCSAQEKMAKRLNGRKLKVKSPKEAIMVSCDASLIVQVLVNLIDNAVKHTKPKSAIEVSCETKDNDAVFTVSDNGGGLKNGTEEAIFEDFYSVTTKEDKNRSTGLGLSICRAIVEAHGGAISAYNNEKGGATFTFHIPALKGENDE